MTLDQLRIFIAVAEREHVTRAAEELNMTQSATSAAIAALEKRYGVQLFDRMKRRITLTSAGKIFLCEAKNVAARAKVAETTLNELAGAPQTLKIAATPLIGNYWLTKEICRFMERQPNIAVELTLMDEERIADAVDDRRIDLGVTEHEPKRSGLRTELIRSEEYVFAESRHLKKAVSSTFPKRWLTRESGSTSRRLFDAAVTEAVDPPLQRLVFPSDQSLKSAIACAAGVGFIPRSMIDDELESGEFLLRPHDRLSFQENYMVTMGGDLKKLTDDFRAFISCHRSPSTRCRNVDLVKSHSQSAPA